ncbi:MAG TPA: LamG-like jellyroll fold domain-containing protein, partial [Actinomycetota bacterium]|nr:LamG-like jellyroll fold domain-containing protein [Actinomycetota bacterium]
ETDEDACPRCGAPLYLTAPSEPAALPPAVPKARSQPLPDVRSGPRGEPVATREDEGREEEALARVGPAGRWRVIVLAVGLTAAVAFGLTRGGSDPDRGLDGRGRTPAEPSAASPTTGPPVPLTTCGGGLPPPIPEPADIVPAATADYLFQGSLESSLGRAPDLAGVGTGSGVFTVDASTGTTVLRFAGGRGLSLTPTTGVIPSSAYTIELLFRLDFVSKYRKIIDFKDGSDDSGLYVLDGCLTFFPREPDALTSIGADSYVQVVLTRDASDSVVGYVDGVRQFAFADARGLAEVNAKKTLRFFVDDRTTTGEHSSGAVSQVRLFDQPLNPSEVAALACTELAIADATFSCRELQR